VRVLETGVWGAYYNVMINLKDIKNKEFVSQVRLLSLTQYFMYRLCIILVQATVYEFTNSACRTGLLHQTKEVHVIT
jgi:hypothetical protein